MSTLIEGLYDRWRDELNTLDWYRRRTKAKNPENTADVIEQRGKVAGAKWALAMALCAQQQTDRLDGKVHFTLSERLADDYHFAVRIARLERHREQTELSTAVAS